MLNCSEATSRILRGRQMLSDREAYLLGEHVLLAGSNPLNVAPGTCNHPAYVYDRVLFVETKFRKELSYEAFYCQSYHHCYARSRLGLTSSLASICCKSRYARPARSDMPLFDCSQ